METGLPLMRESPPGTGMGSRLESRKDLGRGIREKSEGGPVSEWASIKTRTGARGRAQISRIWK